MPDKSGISSNINNLRRIMKTVIIFNQFEEGLTYHVVEGDHRQLHEVYVNGGEEKKEDELIGLLQDKNGYHTIGKISIEEFAKEIANGAALIECGYYL